MVWPLSQSTLSTSASDWPPDLDIPFGALLDADDTLLLDEADFVLIE